MQINELDFFLLGPTNVAGIVMALADSACELQFADGGRFEKVRGRSVVRRRQQV